MSLASGSSGNALVIDAGTTRLLVDAGISARRVEQGLAHLGISAASLDGVLITHEHTDHINGLPVFGRRHGVTCFLTKGTAHAIPGLRHLAHRIVTSYRSFAAGQATITAIPVRHDAAEPSGYLIEVGSTTIAVFTDLGCRELHLFEPLQLADLIVLEANHDLDQLWNGSYPFHLKQRIAGATGHLCNADCGDLLAAAISDQRPRTVWLAHLSQENNDEATAHATVAGRIAGRQLSLAVLPRHTPGPVWESARTLDTVSAAAG